MLSWLKTRLRNYWYDKPITESYMGKIVRCAVRYTTGSIGERQFWHEHLLVKVIDDDGSYNIVGILFREETHYCKWKLLDSKTGLCHFSKQEAEIVADSEVDYYEMIRVRDTRKKWRLSICSNESSEIGFVEDYRNNTFYGRSTTDGTPWESKDPTFLAFSYDEYTKLYKRSER